MERRFFIKTLTAAIAAASAAKFSTSFAQTTPSSSLVAALRLALPGSGRVGFYVDYSELDAPGVHTFYVNRTHGTSGNVSVNFITSGDPHIVTSGTLTWGDGEADIKSFNVTVPSKLSGDHRIVAQLTNATGGAQLHYGSNTIAHGVIDDDTIATINAIFIDASANINGNGSISNPYNNWYAARDNATASTRYIYIKGLLVPNSTDTNAGGLTVNHFRVPNSWGGMRDNESNRLFIRSWPGFAGGIDGGGQTNCAGFYAESTNAENPISYITFRKLNVTNLDNRDGGSTTGKSYFIRSRSNCSFWTAEEVDIDGVRSGANAAVGVWFSEGSSSSGNGEIGHRLWRVNADNCVHVFTGKKLKLFESYRNSETSIQRCTIGLNCGGLYQKSTLVNSSVGLSVKFCYFKNGYVRLSHQGSTSPLADYHIVQSNIFDSVGNPNTTAPLRLDSAGTPFDTSTSHWIVGNVFFNYSNSTHSPIRIEESEYVNAILFNNIFKNTRGTYRIDGGPKPAFSNFNHIHAISGDDFILNKDTQVYSSLSAIQSSTEFESNTVESDPLFTDTSSGEFSLLSHSPCRGTGLSGSDKGAYLTGIEKIGALGQSNTVRKSPPSPPASVNTRIVS